MNKESKINKPEDLLGGIPIIGNKGTAEDKKLIKEAIDEFVKVLDPIMNRLGQAITEMQHRVAVVEDTPKLVFPSVFNVYVHHGFDQGAGAKEVKEVFDKSEAKE